MDLHEIRTHLGSNRIARVIFYIDKTQTMILLHGFINKTNRMPSDDLQLARNNMIKHQKRHK